MSGSLSSSYLSRGDQCAPVIAQLAEIQRSSPLASKDVIRPYCSQTNGSVALTKRAGMQKSVLSRWLHVAEACISLPMMLSIAASEGFSVAGLMQGDLTRMPLPRGVAPDREPRRLRRHDHGRIDRALRSAVAAGAKIPEVAEAVSASTSTLARQEEYYAKLRDSHQTREQARRALAQRQALQRAEVSYSSR